MTSNQILCAGHVNYDVIISIDKIPEPDNYTTMEYPSVSVGGSATNTALALSAFDNNTVLTGSIGDDEYGEHIQQILDSHGINRQLVVSDTGTTVIHAVSTDDADPRYLVHNNGLGHISKDNIDNDTWETTEHVHVTSFEPELAGELAATASTDGKTVSFNPSQGYSEDMFEQVIQNADVVFLNDREANIFRNRYDMDEIVDSTCLVMTHGAAGSTAYTSHGVINHSGFDPNGNVSDTIGAGDSFIAGFLDEWVGEDYPDIKLALDKANACGADAVTRVGAPDTLDIEWIQNKTHNES